MKTDNKPYGTGKLKWVSTEYLENNLDKYTILDTQPNVHDYFMAHLPKAHFLNESTLRAPIEGLPAQYITPEMAAKLFNRAGLDNKTPVVVYTAKGGFKKWGDGLEQCMMAYSLLRMGHKEVYLLDGGMDKWMSEDRETSQVFPKYKEGDFKPDLQKDYFLNMEEVKEHLKKEDTILLDARPGSMYKGETGPWIKSGHIPGAVNLPWSSLMTEENKAQLKPVDEIKNLVEKAGATKDKTVICSCGTGREATNEFTIFKHLLGYPKVKIYEGSFTEWSSYPDNKIAKGPKPQ